MVTIEQKWKSLMTILELLADRGIPRDDLKCELSEFAQNHENVQEFPFYSGDTYVCWPTEPKIGVGVSKIIDCAKNYKCSKIIIVTQKGATPSTNTIINNVKATGVIITLFTVSETQFNPTKHRLVPKHEPLTKKEKQEVLREFGVTPDQMPVVLSTDPIAKWYGFKKGTVLKITRPSSVLLGETAISYRIVK